MYVCIDIHTYIYIYIYTYIYIIFSYPLFPFVEKVMKFNPKVYDPN